MQLIINNWQSEIKRGALTILAFKPNLTPVRLNNIFSDEKPQAAAFGFGFNGRN